MQLRLERLAARGADNFLEIEIQGGRGRDQLANPEGAGRANDRSQVPVVLDAVKYQDEVAPGK